MQWLKVAGFGDNRDQILENIYATSLTKCATSSESQFKSAVANCSIFLRRQFELVKPQMCLTLGSKPLKMLFSVSKKMGEMVGNGYAERELNASLFPLLPDSSIIVPLPHPSPANNSWLSKPENQLKIDNALNLLRKLNDK